LNSNRIQALTPAHNNVANNTCVCHVCLQACADHVRFQQRVGQTPDGCSSSSSSGSAFTSYIAAADLQQAINKYRASNCSEAYYLLTGWVRLIVLALGMQGWQGMSLHVLK
jgi:hypothetical protein